MSFKSPPSQQPRAEEEIRQKAAATTKWVKRVDELEPHEPGYAVASKVERRNRLREIEMAMQDKWQREGTFRENAPPEDDHDGGDDDTNTTTTAKNKFFCTFPYPYMNGSLHLGHAFTITKADFAARYHRLKGQRVLFPFAFHCTGTPIQAAAHRLEREIQEYGLENCRSGVFARQTKEEDQEQHHNHHHEAQNETEGATTKKSGKTKLLAKTGAAPGERLNNKTQWEILQLCDVPDHEIPNFVDPQYWIHYFPPRAMEHLKCFGVHVDWRRSFITTDTNPFYDSFIQWQFRHLFKQGKIAFGKRPTVYSRRDAQACMDHDRASGEGKGPQEYTLIKMRLLDDGVRTLVGRVPAMAAVAADPIFFVAATLRPETMYGQTNCFVLPKGVYGAYRMKSGEVFVCSEHSAVNMAHQQQAGDEAMAAVWGQTDKITDVTGMDLMGLPLIAPYAQYERIYTLPLLTISMTKGTGVVTSVPSDAPDDYAALKDLQTNPKLRQKYGIAEGMVAMYEPISIIRIPGGDPELGVEDWGDMAAVNACEILGVRDQHDKDKLAKIKKSVYSDGFDTGEMAVGSQKGKKVKDAKDAVRKELLDAGLAARYWEPEAEIVSRSGEKCIVAFIDQWYLKYGESSWKEAVMEHVRDKTGRERPTDSENRSGDARTADMESGGDEQTNSFDAFGVHEDYVDSLEWLGSWACSRKFGLGTKLPWDPQFVVDSLSDSTIYMAYYTVAALLQGEGNAYGSKPGPLGILFEDLSDEVWDYIFCKRTTYPNACRIRQQDLDKLRREFEFWYPVDLRVSGKDLIRNHLTMCLYNHAAIWPDNPEMWPRSFFTNGHVKVDSQKMAKSAGNFISLLDAIRGNNVHLFVPDEKREIREATLRADAKGRVATVTTKQPHGLAVGSTIVVSKSKENDGRRTITSVASDAEFTFQRQGREESNNVVIEVTERNWAKQEWRSHGWTTDTVRYALAVAGDAMEDANFESEVANGMILKLENELHWAEEVMSPTCNLRDERMTIQDKLFLLRMDECIREADRMYEQMKFALAMKFGFSDLRIHRKAYREYHENCRLPMHRAVLRKYLEALVVMMNPVTTHWSEYIWCNVLKNEGTVTSAAWPALSGLPPEMLLHDNYVQDVVAYFRKQLAKQKRKKGSDKSLTKAIIFVQPELPSWKRKALKWLAGQWEDENVTFENPKMVLADAVEFQKTSDELKAHKMFMKYIGFVVKQTETLGRSALERQMPFDEAQVLEERKLDIAVLLGFPDGVQIARVTDESVNDVAGKKALAEPGRPSLAAF